MTKKTSVQEERLSYMEIMFKVWEEGSDESKKTLDKHRLLIESYTGSCMDLLEKELNKFNKKLNEEKCKQK